MNERTLGRPLGEFLVRIALEIEEAAASVEELHSLVDAAVKGDGKSDAFLLQAQSIDILQQHLEALASFVGELSEATPSSWRVESDDAISKVKLSRLQERLNQICLSSESEDCQSSGEPHIF